MTAFLIRRFAQSLLFFFASALAGYTIIVMLMPESPYHRYAARNTPITVQIYYPDTKTYETATFPPDVTPAEIEQVEKVYKIDKPWPLNFLYWLFDPRDYTQVDDTTFQEIPKGIDVTLFGIRIRGSGALTGDFGDSTYVANGRPVSELLSTRLGNSALLMVVAVVLSAVVAIPVGAISAGRQGSGLDRVLTFLSFAVLSMPPFLVGLILILFLAVLPKLWHEQGNLWWLPYLPTGDAASVGQDDEILSHFYHIVLPAMTLALVQIATLTRYVRFSMLDVLRREFIRTAWAKGLRWRRVIFKHALRNALIPIITVIGMAIPGLLTGAIVVETLFHYAGLGNLFFTAINTQTHIDTPLFLVLTIFMTAIVIASNLLADLLYMVTDPRVVFSSKLG